MGYKETIERELTDDIFDENILEDFFINSNISFKGQKVRITITCEEVENGN